MMLTIITPLAAYGLSLVVTIAFILWQWRQFVKTRSGLRLYASIFTKLEPYGVESTGPGGRELHTLTVSETMGQDLRRLVSEINRYLEKSRGTTEFAVIRDKTERLLAMRYDEATARLAFPTHIGLMGTFLGVFMGILMFIFKLGDGGITDEAIQQLLGGVMVSMATSLCGLGMTTRNTSRASDARKHVEEEKNSFYDFVQTELMPSLDASMTQAVRHLHQTIDTFEPAFSRVIDKFQATFDRCTRAFGTDFEKNVQAVTSAVQVMGINMEAINLNFEQQKKLIETMNSPRLIKGLDAFARATDRFGEVTSALIVFDNLRQNMIEAISDAVELQREYNKGLEVPREIAVHIAQILDRVKTFEDSIEILGLEIAQSQSLGNNLINRIDAQLSAIEKKDVLAVRYMELADGKLEDFYGAQTKLIDEMSAHYREALNHHITELEAMLTEHEAEARQRQEAFATALEQSIEPGVMHEALAIMPASAKNIEERLAALETTSAQMLEATKADDTPTAVAKSVKELLNALADIRQGLSRVEQATKERPVTNQYSLFAGRRK